MFLLSEPTDEQIRNALLAQARLPLSYAPAGMMRGPAPPGFTVDHTRRRLGGGAATFAAARSALRGWRQVPQGWVRLCWPDVPLAEGATVGVLARLPGMCSLNACRVVYLIDEDGPVRRFGFAYGTLPDHIERGEERFLVEWDCVSGDVWYDILAFSRPAHPLVWAGFPIVRLMQHRFARDSQAAMVRAVAEELAKGRETDDGKRADEEQRIGDGQ
jgi:uncharacterized protein (UPF0548 family)